MGFDFPRLSSSIGAAVGTGTHAGAAHLLECVRDGVAINRPEAEDRAITALEEAMAEGVIFDATTPERGTAQKQTARLVRAYEAHILPLKRPIEVEKSRQATAGDGVILTGTCDLQEGHGISDTKTGVKLSAYHAQAGAYALLARAEGATVTQLTIDYLPRASLKRDQPPPQIIPYDAAACERLAWRVLTAISEAAERFEASGDEDDFLPNPASPLCGPKYCPAHGTDFCPYGKDNTP